MNSKMLLSIVLCGFTSYCVQILHWITLDLSPSSITFVNVLESWLHVVSNSFLR